MTAIPQQHFEIVTCPRCGAPPGVPCEIRSKRPKGPTHLARVDLVLQLADAARRKAERNNRSGRAS